MDIREFQRRIAATYGKKDGARGVTWSYAWLVEEIGELGAALRNMESVRLTGQPDSHKIKSAEAAEANLHEEFADVLAWLSSVAQIAGVDLEAVAVERFGSGCPYCKTSPCSCPLSPMERAAGLTEEDAAAPNPAAGPPIGDPPA